MGCHILDAPFWALKLRYPVSVEGCISTYWQGLVNNVWQEVKPKNEQFPRSTIVRFDFPPREGMPEVRLTWWDGGLMPPRPRELEEGRRMGNEDGGVLFVGDKASLICGCFGVSPRLIPESNMKDFRPPSKTFDRVPGGLTGHERNWLRACKGGKPASSNFDYSGPLSETVLMGNLAVRFPTAGCYGMVRRWRSLTTQRPILTSAGITGRAGVCNIVKNHQPHRPEAKGRIVLPWHKSSAWV